LDTAVRAAFEGEDEAERMSHSAILKDEDRCIRCALCAQRCPSDAITMERVTFQTDWRSS
jgi:NAD-dependent dihydropyrimidine dehydrogenase PreA subunit